MSALTLSANPLVNGKKHFRLSDDFVGKYKRRKPPFGFNGLGELVFLRTYSRIKDDGTNERWWETIRRVVEGVYGMQERWIVANHLGWNEEQAQRSAEEMYDRMFSMKFLPPGRGLWAMGSPLTEERGLFAALFNCGACSSKDIAREGAEPFAWLMEASMCGIGIGFDTRGAGTLAIRALIRSDHYVIPDSREGWVESVRRLLNGFFQNGTAWVFDYSEIRPAGEPIKGFGGVASGPEPLRELHSRLSHLLSDQAGTTISSRMIVDIANLIGTAVIAGNVRRTALLALGAVDDGEFLDLKNYERNPERKNWGWTSNNSLQAIVGMDYTEAARRIVANGEPGFLWLENVQQFGRMGERGRKDPASLCNPCGEIPLVDRELCNICETFPANHDSLDDFKRTLKFAYLFCKTVTLSVTPWEKTNKVMLKNRRVGVSMSGIQQVVAKLGLDTFRRWCEEGYETLQQWDEVYSDWLAVPRSIRLTTGKPSGSVSLLAGATPGMHWPESRTYVRRVRLSSHSELIEPLRTAGYPIEPDAVGRNTVVVSIPVRIGEDVRIVSEVSMWEQLSMAAFMSRYWCDNMQSATISFDPVTEGPEITNALDYFQYSLKSVSFLPRLPQGAFPQMPYEAVTEEGYSRLVAELKPLRLRGVSGEEAEVERFCDRDTCQL